jgi:hypothetical protein
MTPPAPARFLRRLLCATLLVPLAAMAGAQSVRVTSGEHAGFTRLVLQSRDTFTWSLAPTGRERHLQVTAEVVQFDPSEIFRLIPRTRLADLRRAEGGLELVLNCDCEIRTDASRAGLVVLDILDAPSPAPAAHPVTNRANAPHDVARTAGGDLARRMRAEADPAPDDPSAAAPGLSATAMMEHLARQVSQAVAQGLLSTEHGHPGSVMRASEAQVNGVDPSNLRISLATEPPDQPGANDPSGRDVCHERDLLAFPIEENAPPYHARHAALMRGLYGEFDLPDAAGHEALARLYLEHGFGAEARLVLENAPAQVSGRDLLLGLSDILEDRYSNARLRLSERIDCGGSMSLFAAIAGAEAAGIDRHAMQIARAFGDLPVPMRRALGEALVRRLLDAQAQDAARMIADTLRHAVGPGVPEMPLIDALLDAARGDVDRAAARLDHDGRKDGATFVMRLRLALDGGQRPSASLLADAEAIAASERRSETGIELMSLLIRLRNASSEPDEAFELLDRLQRWVPESSPETADLADLRDATWSTLIGTADDRDFLQTVFERADWQAGALRRPTRLALTERLLDFGLTDPAATLLEGLAGNAARLLRGRLLILDGRPSEALDALSGLEDADAVRLRALARRMSGSEPGRADREPDARDVEPASSDAAAPAPPLAGDGNIMQRGAALLSESSQLRDALGAILDANR